MTVRQLPLGELVEPGGADVAVAADRSYRIAGIYSFGRGLFEREEILGADTSYKTLVRVSRDELVVSKLNGWEGAVDVVQAEIDGCHVSSEYPVFRLDVTRLDPAYMRWITRWPAFWDRLVPRGSMVRRKRVQPQQFLSVTIPVPDVREQRRIAARLDQAQGRTERIARLASRSVQLSLAFMTACASAPHSTVEDKLGQGWRQMELGTVLTRAEDRVAVHLDSSYPNLGIYSFGRGVFEKPPIEGDATSAKSLFRVRAGQFIYSRLFAFEGAYALVPERFDGYFVSNEFPSFDADSEQLDPRWLAAYLRSPERWAELASASVGLGVRRQRVPVEAVLGYQLLLPPLTRQVEMIHSIERVDALRTKRASSDARLEAVVPSLLNREFASLA